MRVLIVHYKNAAYNRVLLSIKTQIFDISHVGRRKWPGEYEFTA